MSWRWIIGPCFLYLCERLYRLYKSQTRQLQILKIVKLPDSSPVMEIQFQKVTTEAGQVCVVMWCRVMLCGAV